MGEPPKVRHLNISMWMDLAEHDPAKFEAMRTEAINRAIESASERHRIQLQRLQWRVDRIRERAATPMAATLAISEMMWDSFYRLHDSYQDLLGSTSGRQDKLRLAKPVKSAQILPFRPVPVEV